MYSNLPEVVRLSNLPEVVPSDAPQVTQTSGLETVADKYYFNTHELPTTQLDSGSSATSLSIKHQGREQRILGLRRRTFLTIALISAILIIGVIVGVAVSVTKAASSTANGGAGEEGGASPPTSPISNNSTTVSNGTSSLILEGSSLATGNYTDGDGSHHLFVFYQGLDNALLTSVWDSKNRTWETHSISGSLAETGVVHEILPRAPISAFSYTNPTFQIRVYTLTAGNVIHEFLTSDVTLATGWIQGDLGTENIVTTGNGSKLAALRPQCGTGESCRKDFPGFAVAYQNEASRLEVFNIRSLETTDIGPSTNGSIISLTGVMRDNITDFVWRLHYDEKGVLQESSSEGQLDSWTQEQPIGSASSSTDVTNMAAFPYDLVNMMVVTLESNGRAVVRTLSNDGWVINQTPTFLETPLTELKFSAIAGNPHKRIYGLMNGTIHEWMFRSEDPLQWRHLGMIII
ncbi:hypothetical protein B0T25DRAFT_571705 [Lasiosphaeria hispida]|uniref:Fucose-specific lectin n=1 Tax=Lasiosphaeria hispida TaxID=260671 RepID=A0AAJ0HCA0_9PEZI|nr:hypothetical protein B0T25DRAFT_571705 [Lasiosphaeria hispida]